MNAAIIKASLFSSLAVLAFLSACDKPEEEKGKAAPKVEASAAAEELPICEINSVENCEKESSSASETIYRCPLCGSEAEGGCPHCSQHACKDCGTQECRCRVKHEVLPGVVTPP